MCAAVVTTTSAALVEWRIQVPKVISSQHVKTIQSSARALTEGYILVCSGDYNWSCLELHQYIWSGNNIIHCVRTIKGAASALTEGYILVCSGDYNWSCLELHG
ncbi:uncharacterized protein [Asterias amurensis]|uniref:uncharacterized protein n=1 Tax=Asterias amurensis TaxID=7602 RepID=UPI003AB8BD02